MKQVIIENIETKQMKPPSKRRKENSEKQLSETLLDISSYYNYDEETRQKILESVETNSEYTEEMKQVTLGELIGNYAERTVAERLIGQRPADDSEVEDAKRNYGILKGLLNGKIIKLVKIKPLLEGFKKKLEIEDNTHLRDFYQSRIDACEQHLSNGKDLHIADGQHRINHIVRVFHPHSEVPIVLDKPILWDYESTDALGNTSMTKIDIDGRSMSGNGALPEVVKQRILSHTTLIHIIESEDDVLIGEIFFDDNNTKPAPSSTRIGVLARSPLKAQLEKLESRRSSKKLLNSKYTKLQHWSLMDFLKDRAEAGGQSSSIWGANSNGFQTILLNIACRLYGDDFAKTGKAHGVQGKVPFHNEGFTKFCAEILLHPVAELIAKHFAELGVIVDSIAVAHDRIMEPKTKAIKQWSGKLKFCNIVNDALCAEVLLYGQEFKGKYDIDDWDEIMSEFAVWDKREQDRTKYVMWSDRDVAEGLIYRREENTPKYVLIGKKNPYRNAENKLVYVERNEGYHFDSNKNQYESKRLEYRSKCIESFCSDNKDKWLTNGWISEVVDQVKTPQVFRYLYDRQNGVCAMSSKPITVEQLTTSDVDIDYQFKKKGQLVLTSVLQEKSLDNFLEI